MLLRLALRNVFRHRTRSLVTLSAIAFGCVSLIFTGGFFEDIFYKMQESYIQAHTGHLQVHRRGFSTHGNAEPYEYLIEDPNPIIRAIRELPEVSYVTRRLQFSGLLSTGETSIACIGQGVEPQYEPTVRFNAEVDRGGNQTIRGSVIESGDPLGATDTFSAILGRGLAAGIGAKAGDGMIVVSNTIGGAINALDVTVKGTFFTSAKEFDDRVLRVPLATAQKLLHTESVQTLVVMLKHTDDTARVKAALTELFEQRQLDLELKSWDELSDFYTKSRDFLGRLFNILKLIIAIIVILSIYNTMNMAVLERTSEIGTIMALGTKRRGVLQLFLAEGLLLGAIGGALGLLAGILINSLIRRIGIPMPPPPGATIKWLSQPVIVPTVLLFSFLLSVVTSLLSAFFPAHKASRLQIADALRARG